MKALTLKQLRYFESLARIGHFGRAAEDSAISQPALSMQIRELEALVGAPLVERSSRSLRLTTLGEEFAERARQILQSVDELSELVRATTEEFNGRLRIGIIPTVAPYLLPHIIHLLAARWTGMELRPREAGTKELLAELGEGKLDLAVVALPVAESWLESAPLFDEEFLLVRHASARGQPVPDAAHLAAMKLLLLGEGHCFRDQALSFCKINAAPLPDNMMEGSSLSTLVQMVGAGIGVTLLPQMAVAIETRSADVIVDRLAAPRPGRRLGLVWRRSNPLSSQLSRIAEVLQAGLQPAPLPEAQHPPQPPL